MTVNGIEANSCFKHGFRHVMCLRNKVTKIKINTAVLLIGLREKCKFICTHN